jgi:hypothetical protein
MNWVLGSHGSAYEEYRLQRRVIQRKPDVSEENIASILKVEK